MRRQILISVFVGAGLFLGACGGEEKSEEEWKAEPLVPPGLTAVTPTEIVLGDDITVIGQDFPHRDNGSLGLQLAGEFTDEEGNVSFFDQEIALTVKDDGVATAPFETVLFHPQGNKLGVFRGQALLVTTPFTPPTNDDVSSGGPLRSETKEVDIRVGPSIMVRRMRPIGSSCQPVTEGTNPNKRVELEIEVLGFGQASPDRRWEFEVGFRSPDIIATFAAEESVGTWPVTNEVVGNAPNGENTMRGLISTGSVFSLRPHLEEQVVEISNPISIGDRTHFRGLSLVSLTTGSLGENDLDTLAPMVFSVHTSDGRSIRRNFSYRIAKERTHSGWDGETRIVERSVPQPQGGCVHAFPRELEVRYGESVTIHKQTSIGYREDLGANQQAGFSAGPFNVFQVQTHAGWNQTFSTDINNSISSDVHSSRDVSTQIIPGFFGQSYRQLIKYERKVGLVLNTECGETFDGGDIVLYEWDFAFQIDQGPTCPPAPTLPPAIQDGEILIPLHNDPNS